MLTEAELLERIKGLVREGNFRIRPHAARHIIEEGFSEADMIEAILGKSSVLEHYPLESRCLILGQFRLTKSTRSPLHLVIEYWHERAVDIVSVYIPQKPWWLTPWQRGKAI